MLNRLRSLDAIDAPFALGERVMPPAPVAAIAPKAVADWTRATMADILTDAERGALAEAFPVPKCIAKPAVDMHDSAPVQSGNVAGFPARVDLSSTTDPELRAVSERMHEGLRKTYGIGVGLATTEALAAKADADGWIKHDGGDCPVPAHTMVWVRMADGYERGIPDRADWYSDGLSLNDWRHDAIGSRRIVAYRLAVPQ